MAEKFNPENFGVDFHVGGFIAMKIRDYTLSMNIVKNNEGETVLNSPVYYNDLALRMGKPLYIGEYGIIGYPKTRTDVWEKNPGWIVNFNDENTGALMKRSLDILVEKGVPLTHWFAYKSDFTWDKSNTDLISPEANREYFDLIVDANRKLQEK